MNSILDDISAVIGFTATLKLAAWYGDGISNCFVPAALDEDSVLVKILGLSAAKKLVQEFPRQHLPVPSLRAYELESRRRTIARFITHGMSVREIAMVMKMSEKRVRQIEGELIEAKLLQKNTPLEKAAADTLRQTQGKFGQIGDMTADRAVAAMVNSSARRKAGRKAAVSLEVVIDNGTPTAAGQQGHPDVLGAAPAEGKNGARLHEDPSSTDIDDLLGL